MSLPWVVIMLSCQHSAGVFSRDTMPSFPWLPLSSKQTENGRWEELVCPETSLLKRTGQQDSDRQSSPSAGVGLYQAPLRTESSRVMMSGSHARLRGSNLHSVLHQERGPWEVTYLSQNPFNCYGYYVMSKLINIWKSPKECPMWSG